MKTAVTRHGQRQRRTILLMTPTVRRRAKRHLPAIFMPRVTIRVATFVLVLTGSAAAQEPVPACKVQGSHEWLSQRSSPLDSATLVIAGTTAKVCYSRPSARGRVVFGGIVPYNKLWRTGANEPTVLHLPFPAEVAGIRLEAGTGKNTHQADRVIAQAPDEQPPVSVAA